MCITIIQPTDVSHERDRKMIVAHYQPLYMGSFGYCTVVFVSVTFIAMLMMPITRLSNVAGVETKEIMVINSIAENPCGQLMRN